MNQLNLTGQKAAKEFIQPKLDELTLLLEQRKPYWNRASEAFKEKYVESDVIMKQAYDFFKYLQNNYNFMRFVEREV